MPYLVELAEDEGITEITYDNINDWLEGYLFQSRLGSDVYTILALEDVEAKEFRSHIITKKNRDIINIKEYVASFDEVFHLTKSGRVGNPTKLYRIWIGRIETLEAADSLFEVPHMDNTKAIVENALELEEVWDNTMEF